MELRQPKPVEAAAKQVSLLDSAVRHVGRVERSVLIIGVLLTSLVWGFVELAGEVVEGGTEALDRALPAIDKTTSKAARFLPVSSK